MRTTITILLISLFSNLSYSQLNWTVIKYDSIGNRYDDVFFLDDNLGWAVDGPGGSVYKTTDGGQTWEMKFETSNYLRNIEFLNADIGFFGTLDDKFYRSTDGGDTWSLVTLSPNPPAICGLDAVGSSTIYGCGAFFTFPPANIIKSVDSGVTWQYIDMSAYATGLVEILFIDELLGYVSGRSSTGGIILKTEDGGVTWTEIYNSQIPGEYVWKLQLLENNTHIYGSIQSPVEGKLVKSTDSGQTWETKPSVEKFVQAVGFITPDHGWMGGHTTGFYETTDGGDTWNFLGIGNNLNRIFVINEHLVYASGAGLYKYGYSTLSTGITEGKPKDALSVTIHPNPFSEKLNFTIDFQHADNLVAEIYDASGKFLQELLTDKVGKAQKKNYSVDFPYSAGTYILNIHTNNGRRSLNVSKM
ncbi:YCF48-related protein [uncultured Fluviicola sp.]|uniref:YCF48-related protein n=1 Tax=uncultured Fluviicola sp. TaxID=463303 RepID=UPI0025FE1A44|nr:YCF48-related protein [uncultured Fluviicola sp.]